MFAPVPPTSPIVALEADQTQSWADVVADAGALGGGFESGEEGADSPGIFPYNDRGCGFPADVAVISARSAFA